MEWRRRVASGLAPSRRIRFSADGSMAKHEQKLGRRARRHMPANTTKGTDRPKRKPPNPKPPIEFSPAQVETIRSMSDEGRPLREIAEAVGVSITTLRRRFQADLGHRQRGPKPMVWAEAVRDIVLAMRAFGIPKLTIARALHTSIGTLNAHFRDEMETALAVMTTNVAANLYQHATGDGPGAVQAAKFFLACKGGWVEEHRRVAPPPPPDTPGADGPLIPGEAGSLADRDDLRSTLRLLAPAERQKLVDALEAVRAAKARVVSGDAAPNNNT